MKHTKFLNVTRGQKAEIWSHESILSHQLVETKLQDLDRRLSAASLSLPFPGSIRVAEVRVTAESGHSATTYDLLDNRIPQIPSAQLTGLLHKLRSRAGRLPLA